MQTAEVAQGQLLCRNSTQLLSGKLGKLLSQKTWKAPLMETHENLENSWLMAMEDRRNSLKRDMTSVSNYFSTFYTTVLNFSYDCFDPSLNPINLGFVLKSILSRSKVTEWQWQIKFIG